jgi:hypothetical protein
MSDHLSQDQISRCILGQASAEEYEHSRNCPQCRAEVSLHEPVATFQSVMKEWSEREAVPGFDELQRVSSHPLWLGWPVLRWAVAGAVVVVLAIIPTFVKNRPESGLESPVTRQAVVESNEDVQLMQEVMVHLSRPIPMPMERVMVLIPSEDASMVGQRETTQRGKIQ